MGGKERELKTRALESYSRVEDKDKLIEICNAVLLML